MNPLFVFVSVCAWLVSCLFGSGVHVRHYRVCLGLVRLFCYRAVAVRCGFVVSPFAAY